MSTRANSRRVGTKRSCDEAGKARAIAADGGRAPAACTPRPRRGETLLRIGMDDTDSVDGMCTTYIGFRLAAELRRAGARFADYPRLVRLNPNVPWKTRGNGAVGMSVYTGDPAAARESTVRMLERHSDVRGGANPAAAFIKGGGAVPRPVAGFAREALRTLIGRTEARRFPARHGVDVESLGNGQGIVGAVAAAGYEFGVDSTLELLSYRRPAMFGRPRRIDAPSVRRMQDATRPRTFNSYDERTRRPLIAPRGPDPVLYGIRGEDLPALLRARRMVGTGGEEASGYAVYRTNQGTGEHLLADIGGAPPEPYESGTIEGTVVGPAPRGPGGHAYFDVRTAGAAAVVRCAAYRRSGLAGTAALLAAGDRVRVGGGVRPASRSLPRVLNAEVIEVVSVARAWRDENPRCLPCGRSMKSRGRGQGYACPRCGKPAPAGGGKARVEAPRGLRAGTYVPPPSSQRHLARPLQRRGVRGAPRFDGRSGWLRLEMSSGE